MLADIKGPHLDFLGGPNSLSHGSVYCNQSELMNVSAGVDYVACIISTIIYIQ